MHSLLGCAVLNPGMKKSYCHYRKLLLDERMSGNMSANRSANPSLDLSIPSMLT